VTIRLRDRGVRLVLLDIEGTTTPLAFVQEKLFPYARARLSAFVRDPRHAREVDDIRARLAAECAEDVTRGEEIPAPAGPDHLRQGYGHLRVKLRWPTAASAEVGDPPKRLAKAEGPAYVRNENVRMDDDAVVAYATWLMDRDRKSPGLKLLQGLIWEDGYQAGELRGEVYDDVPDAIRRWRDAGVRVAIYSSGSVLAQRRLFESTTHGDLTPLLDGFFDTGVGAKVEAASYRRIAEAVGEPPRSLFFLSDVSKELDAASEAGAQVALVVRPGNPAHDPAGRDVVSSFDEIVA
jgi:enolase-phosphatase E1